MKCKSCQEEVSQKFNHAISVNICPYCGQEIVPLELQAALADLKEVMKATEQFKEEIFDWLHFNYQLISKESEEYKTLQSKAEASISHRAPLKVDPKTVNLDRNGNQISGAPIQDQETTNKFLQRAQVKDVGQKNIRDIINNVKKGEGTVITAEADPEEVSKLGSALFGDDGGVASVNGSGDDDDYYVDEETLPPIVEAMAQQGRNVQSGDYNARDVAKLQALHGKQQQARRAMKSGSVGLIRR